MARGGRGDRYRPHGRRNREPSENQKGRRTIRGLLSGMGNDPQVQQWIDQTPATGHMEGDAPRMQREVDNWPHAWMPEESPARARLKAGIAADPDETYVYYPIGGHRPVIWAEGRRWTLEEYQERYG